VRYVGQISYGLYLYHWPIFLATDHVHTGLSGATLLAVRLGLTFVAAAASAKYIEEPIRRRDHLSAKRVLVGLPLVTVALVATLVLCTQPPSGAGVTATEQLTPALLKRLPPPGPPVPQGEEVRALVFGDSFGVMLERGLTVDAASWGVSIVPASKDGCDLLPLSMIQFQGGQPTPMSTACVGWQQSWATQIDSVNPDVVALVAGRWMVLNRQIDGQWYTIGDKPLQDEISAVLDQVIEIGSAKGAKVALFTLPYVRGTSTSPSGAPWDLNEPWRTDVYNRLVREAVARHPRSSFVVDTNKMLDPAGVYTDYLDGIRVRDTDEEHPSLAGAMYLRPQVLPLLRQASLRHLAAQPPPPPAHPSSPATTG
jgi:hypothetical protein